MAFRNGLFLLAITFGLLASYAYLSDIQDIGASTWGPRLTDCNKCFLKMPDSYESCSAYLKWVTAQKCAVNTTACTDIYIAQLAGTCLLRNRRWNDGSCMPDSHCTDFMYDGNFMIAPRRAPLAKISFDGVTNDIPDCGYSLRNWFLEPPPCEWDQRFTEIKECLAGYQSTTNTVAKGYIEAFNTEYISRQCNPEDFKNNGTGFVKL